MLTDTGLPRARSEGFPCVYGGGAGRSGRRTRHVHHAHHGHHSHHADHARRLGAPALPVLVAPAVTGPALAPAVSGPAFLVMARTGVFHRSGVGLAI
ncbi:hypothetical protein AMK32_05150 [Streptomyces sp. CB01883]|nr:hypothetical protein AMK32_05150 [Streptomyces sp. CB01883]